MDWQIVESLAPSLAWPIVALSALPFIIWRLDNLIKAIGQARELSDQLPILIDLSSELSKAAQTLTEIQRNTEEIKGTQKVEQAERLAEDPERESLPVPDNIEAPPVDGSRNVQVGVKHRYEQLANSWRDVLVGLDKAYERARLQPPDRRSVGSAALVLTDKRRRSPLTLEDAELLATLHGLYRKFVRLKALRPEALSQGVLEDFERSSRIALEKLDKFAT